MTAEPEEDVSGRDRTRQVLLDAGQAILRERGTSAEIDIKLTDVLARTGYTTGAAYPIFGNQEGYQRELALYVAANFDWAGPEAITDELVQILETSESLEETIMRGTQRYFEVFTANEDFYLALQFWAVREPWPELQASLQEGYRVVHDGFATLFGMILDIYDRRPKPGFTIDDITVAITALTEGLALRHRIDSRAADSCTVTTNLADLYGHTLISIANQFTEPTEE